MTIHDIDWLQLGKDLRKSADDAHDGDTPGVRLAYQFLLDNPECFAQSTLGRRGECYFWPDEMPQTPPDELIAGYHGVEREG